MSLVLDTFEVIVAGIQSDTSYTSSTNFTSDKMRRWKPKSLQLTAKYGAKRVLPVK